MNDYGVVVIGAGPAGLAAAIAAHDKGARVLVIEREARPGGILKQCIHDGFGLLRFGKKLSGPEYAEQYADMLEERQIELRLLTFVTGIKKTREGFDTGVVSRSGVEHIKSDTVILATGCRERTAKQVAIHGTRPSGVFTAGTAQALTNIYGKLPTKKCVILGSGDIGLIMARRLTLEGAQVLGVYEAKSTPSGLTRNLRQCLEDYDIPLYLSHTVTRVFGDERLTAVEVARVDESMAPVEGTEQIIECDALILSVGLIPENELAQTLGAPLDKRTKGPVCDNTCMTQIDGLYSCGNALHVNDLVDYVSENAALAGEMAAQYTPDAKKTLVPLDSGDGLLYLVPQRINLNNRANDVIIYFRSKCELEDCTLRVYCDGKTVYEKSYKHVRPPEMERIKIDFTKLGVNQNSKILFELK